jgi:hypothetical protein
VDETDSSGALYLDTHWLGDVARMQALSIDKWQTVKGGSPPLAHIIGSVLDVVSDIVDHVRDRIRHLWNSGAVTVRVCRIKPSGIQEHKTGKNSSQVF